MARARGRWERPAWLQSAGFGGVPGEAVRERLESGYAGRRVRSWYASTRGAYDLAVEFDAVDVLLDEPLRPDYNIAPTVDVPIVRRSRRAGGRVVDAARWGLVPSWAADPAIGSRMFNARAETLVDKPAFRAAFLRRRCLVAADGWYEWAPYSDRPGKQAYYLAPADGSPLVFAGLWEVWGSGPDRLTSCTIVTTAAVGQLREVYDRMPLVLPAARWAAWLGETAGGDQGEPAAPARCSRLRRPGWSPR